MRPLGETFKLTLLYSEGALKTSHDSNRSGKSRLLWISEVRVRVRKNAFLDQGVSRRAVREDWPRDERKLYILATIGSSLSPLTPLDVVCCTWTGSDRRKCLFRLSTTLRANQVPSVPLVSAGSNNTAASDVQVRRKFSTSRVATPRAPRRLRPLPLPAGLCIAPQSVTSTAFPGSTK
jgi:hypothetical protein